MNSGQLRQLIRAEYLVDAKGLNKIQGMPFTSAEIKAAATEFLKQ
jgi:2-oxoglutarate ferredoxin oxidoreductase subunit alpha